MAESTADRESRFRSGVDAFRAGRLAEARLAWKALWDEEDDPEHRSFLQALVQVVAALEKRAADPEAGRRLLALARPKLAALPDAYGGLDVASLLAALDEGGGAPDLAGAGTPLAWGKARPAPPKVLPRDRPGHFRKAMAAYGAGAFFDAHELWEDLWRDEPDPFQKNFVQGLIQIAAAMHKLLVMGGTTGAIHLLGRALLRLKDVPNGYAGMAVDAIKRDVARAKNEVERLAAAGRTDLDPALVPKIAGL